LTFPIGSAFISVFPILSCNFESLQQTRMKTPLCITTVFFALLINFGRAQLLVVEPDNYTNGTVLNHIIPEVSLITAGSNNQPHPPVPFDVRATTSTFPFIPPTGSNVFAHAGGIPFWYTDRRLRMDFAGLVSTLSIDYQGGTTSVQEHGTLEVYNGQNVLLASYVTGPLLGGQIETMSINRASPDIAYAIAYALPGDVAFGRLDHLVFNTPVPAPEPSVWWTLALGVVGIIAAQRRLRSSAASRMR
jgi:hypothetical protein